MSMKSGRFRLFTEVCNLIEGIHPPPLFELCLYVCFLSSCQLQVIWMPGWELEQTSERQKKELREQERE